MSGTDINNIGTVIDGMELLDTSNEDSLDTDSMPEEANQDGSLIMPELLYEDDDGVASEVERFSRYRGNNMVVMEAENEENRFELKYINASNIAIAGQRIRQKRVNVQSIARSVATNGLMEPIVVARTATDGVYVLLHGYRRLLGSLRNGMQVLPCVINNRVASDDIPIIESIYNINESYCNSDIVKYIEHLETQRGIHSSAIIEYLASMEEGDYAKLKDILENAGDEIVSEFMEDRVSIQDAYKKLEAKRKKSSAEERNLAKAEKALSEQGLQAIDAGEGGGEYDRDIQGANEYLESLNKLNEGLDDISLSEIVQEGKEIEGFQPKKQKAGEREYIDPVIKTATFVRDEYKCVCCHAGGEAFIGVLDFHHVLPVFLGGEDTVENGATTCLTCHRMIHLYSTGDLVMPVEKTQDDIDLLGHEEKIEYQLEVDRYKRVAKLGTIIRKGIARKGQSRQEFKKEHPNTSIGRHAPWEDQKRA